ncbi:MFS transporter [Frateuria aurantia]
MSAVGSPAVPHELARNDAKTLILSALGGALEFYDFVVFVFFTKVLGGLFFPAGMSPWLAQFQVFGIFAAGYLARPLGGVAMAHFGDRLGRKRMFSLSVLLMALPTLCIGLLPDYARAGVFAPVLLLLLRVLQGVAIGGEMPGAWVFVAEHAPRRRVGFALSSLTSGITAGILMGSLMAAWISHHFSPDEIHGYAWRIPFLLGGLFGLLSVWMRRWLSETPVFEAMRANRELAEGLPLKQVVSGHGRGIAISMLVTWLLTAAIVVVILMTPTLVQTAFHLPATLAFTGSSLAAASLVVGTLASGWLVDRLGRALSMALYLLALIVMTRLLFSDLAAGGHHFLLLYSLTGFTVGVVGVVPAVMVAAFPAAIRYSGIAFAYNLAYALSGAVTPPLIASLSKLYGPMAAADYVIGIAGFSLLTAAYLAFSRKGDFER